MQVKFTQQKGSCIPTQLQEAIQNTIARLMSERHIEKLSTVNIMVLVQLIVFTVKTCENCNKRTKIE